MTVKKFLGIVLCGIILIFGVAGVANALDIVFEDAEDGDTLGWIVYDNTPAGAMISNVFDTGRGSNVIDLSGNGLSNGYVLGSEYLYGIGWHHTEGFQFEWSMKYSEDFQVFFEVDTTVGVRFIYYSPVDYDGFNYEGILYPHHGLGLDAKDGQWHSFSRNLQDDLAEVQPGVSILEVNGFLIRGSGRVDDIKDPLGIPDASAVFLLGSASLIGFAGFRRRFKKS